MQNAATAWTRLVIDVDDDIDPGQMSRQAAPIATGRSWYPWSAVLVGSGTTAVLGAVLVRLLDVGLFGLRQQEMQLLGVDLLRATTEDRAFVLR